MTANFALHWNGRTMITAPDFSEAEAVAMIADLILLRNFPSREEDSSRVLDAARCLRRFAKSREHAVAIIDWIKFNVEWFPVPSDFMNAAAGSSPAPSLEAWDGTHDPGCDDGYIHAEHNGVEAVRRCRCRGRTKA